jgi:hypothetical protein
MEIFSTRTDSTLHARVAAMWNFIERFPMPKFELNCGCGSTDIKLMVYTFCRKDEIHVTQKGGQRSGCSMMCRCRNCGALSEYTAAVSDEIWELRSDNGNPSMYHWEKALAVIEAAKPKRKAWA